ncbi:MAG: alkaline phosphatase family protein [Bacteroidales bacterium]|nr:alkaline phosphatase family protein [Bacteroidales bacterium]
MKQNNATSGLLATTLIFLLALQAIEAHASHPATKQVAPKLIVGITVDQLRTDFINALQGKLTSGGFRRLLGQSLMFEQVLYNCDMPDATAAMAVLATGVEPFYNGVTGQNTFDAQQLRRQSILFDKDVTGTFSSLQVSPKALLSTTLGDELKIASEGTSRIYSIAPDAETAIIGAGHMGDCALWFDEKEAKWAGSSYYREFPKYFVKKNDQQPLSVHLGSLRWEPMVKSDDRLEIMPYSPISNGFSHDFIQYGKHAYSWIKTSPVINDAIVELARLSMRDGKIGKGKNTDMLQLTLYAGTYQHAAPEAYAEELQDIYLRLDKSLNDLLNYIDAEVGLSNTFIYVNGTGQVATPSSEIANLSQGIFTASRCTSLLNSYLISLYGQGNWVAGYHDNQIYLAHDFIARQNIKLSEIQQAASEFVMMFSGVADVVTQHQILHNVANERIENLRKIYNRKTGGDLVITLQPGWAFKEKDNSPTQQQLRHDIAPGPAIFFFPGITPKRITAPINAKAIAPTLARLIRIRAPSGCTTAPVSLNQ